MTQPARSTDAYAGFWIRVWAALIDFFLLALILVPILLGVYGKDYFSSDAPLIAGPVDFLLNWVVPAIVIILFWMYKAATPGKMAVGLRIVDAKSGTTPTTGQCVGRYLGYYVSLLPLFAGIVWVAFDSRKQGFHDKLAGTVVIRRRGTTEEPPTFRPAP
ncbi:MAG TPA: RDD family protein [Gemmatimonadaceae bacterium]|nr:RDD family protein [Gemmatimonadaceae bacterium]